MSASAPESPPPGAEQPFQPGELLEGRFGIVREISRGGMGVVYEAFDHKLERRIAVKCALAGLGNRLPREVRNASDVSHPNICKSFEIHTATTARGQVEFLTMEFLDGETLAARLRRGPPLRKQASAIAQQLCAGLAEAHRNGVIHGDLKSSNVILTTAGDGSMRAVITDFGLAQRSTSSARAAPQATGGGTPDYMAPELWRGEKASAASDIYALGVILYELASGRRPSQVPVDLAAPTVTLQEDGPAQRPPPRLPSVDAKWDRVITRCLNPDPARRFQSASQVARALAPRSRRWLLAAAAAVVLALLTGVVAYRRASGPQETVRLALLPFKIGSNAPPAAAGVMRDASVQIARLKGNARTRLKVIPLENTLRKRVDGVESARAALGASHALQGTLDGDNDKVLVHAYLTNTRSGVVAKDWRGEYAAGETRYAGVALAGIVSEALHLAPLPATVNQAARNDYEKGLACLRGDTEVDAALASLERAVSADKDSPLAYAELSRAQWLKYSITSLKPWLERSVESLRRAQQRHPDLPAVHIMSGALKAHEGWYEQAAAEFRRVIEIDPKNGDAFRRLGGAYAQNNQPNDALAAYRQSVTIDPENYRNHQALGAFYFDRADYVEAVNHFRRTVELKPDQPHPRFALALACLNLGQFREAEEELRRSIGLQVTNEALQTLGHVLMYQGRDKDAVPYLLRALKLDERQYTAWSHLATAYRHMALRAEEERASRHALAIVERELARNPRSGDLRSLLAYLSARLGDRGRAESEIVQALHQSPNDANTRWRAVMTYEALGRRESALELLRSAPAGFLADLNRWPDAAELCRDPRFKGLLALGQIR